jgi:hypothetical protein
MLRLFSLSILNENPAWHVIKANGANLVRAMKIALLVVLLVPIDNSSLSDSRRGTGQKWVIVV